MALITGSQESKGSNLQKDFKNLEQATELAELLSIGFFFSNLCKMLIFDYNADLKNWNQFGLGHYVLFDCIRRVTERAEDFLFTCK